MGYGKPMFVECEVEIEVRDPYDARLDDHGMKLWVQRSFKDNSCYRLSGFKRDKATKAKLRAVVAVSTAPLPEVERTQLETSPSEAGLRAFLEKMFVGAGALRMMGVPQLKAV